MKVYEVPLTLAENYSDIKIKACTKKSLSQFCAYNLLDVKISGERLQDQWSSGYIYYYEYTSDCCFEATQTTQAHTEGLPLNHLRNVESFSRRNKVGI